LAENEVYRQFAAERRAVIVAPAGCGKTELIARAVAYCSVDSRQLILTHTHAGVDAIRHRLRGLNIPESHYHVETIHSFALRYAAAYPTSSSIANVRPRNNEDYIGIIKSAERLMKNRLTREVLSHSYGGAFVDEYQDCTLDQHHLILGLAEVLPCRIVGDPLQGIFDFGDNQIVDWNRDVYPFFTRLPDLVYPWRWKDSCPPLGKWLTEIVRPTLERRELLPLHQAVQAGICTWTQDVSGQYGPATRTKVLLEALKCDEATFVICPPQPEYVSLPHQLAGNLKNHYRSIEPTTSQELHDFAENIEAHRGADRLRAVHDFAKRCLTGQQDLDAVVKATLKGGTVRTTGRRSLRALTDEVISNESLVPVANLFQFLEKNGNPTIRRDQLWREMRKALAEVISGGVSTLVEATHLVRNRGALMGRRIPKRCISRTLLLKGLQCEHAIVIDADSLDTKNLYVAMTRASRMLHILSKERILRARDAGHS
jgi:hypothetical protein